MNAACDNLVGIDSDGVDLDEDLACGWRRAWHGFHLQHAGLAILADDDCLHVSTHVLRVCGKKGATEFSKLNALTARSGEITRDG